MKQWLTKCGAYTVERVPCPYSGTVDLSKPRAGVMHTTEGPTIDGAMSVFKQHYAPHFCVGPGRILQLVPLGAMAASLENASGGVETNRWAVAQIEVVGFSQIQLWLPSQKTLDPLVALISALKTEAGIPFAHPFPDQLDPSVTWATPSNPHRKSGKWGTQAGWYGHVDVPENSHWDAGSLRYHALFSAATLLLPVTAWDVTYTTKAGTLSTDRTAHLRRHRLRHPGMFQRGVVNYKPIR